MKDQDKSKFTPSKESEEAPPAASSTDEDKLKRDEDELQKRLAEESVKAGQRRQQ